MSTRADRSLRGAPVLAIALVGFTLLATAAVRLAELPPAASPVAARDASGAALLVSQRLRFLDRADGGVVIERIGGATTVLAPGSHSGFIRGVLRGFARDRRMRRLSARVPFELSAWADGGLSLTDLATGRTVELNGFGPDNRAAFAALLESR